MDWVVHIGLGELALGGLLGWAMVAQSERPDLVKRAGVIAPHRIRQVHLDYVMMGLILIAVGLAIPGLSDWIAVPLVFGTIVNALLFVPPAFSREVEQRLWYRAPRSFRSSASRADFSPRRSAAPHDLSTSRRACGDPSWRSASRRTGS